MFRKTLNLIFGGDLSFKSSGEARVPGAFGFLPFDQPRDVLPWRRNANISPFPTVRSGNLAENHFGLTCALSEDCQTNIS